MAFAGSSGLTYSLLAQAKRPQWYKMPRVAGAGKVLFPLLPGSMPTFVQILFGPAAQEAKRASPLFTDPDMACNDLPCSAYNGKCVRQAILSERPWRRAADKPFSYAMEELVKRLVPKYRPRYPGRLLPGRPQ